MRPLTLVIVTVVFTAAPSYGFVQCLVTQNFGLVMGICALAAGIGISLTGLCWCLLYGPDNPTERRRLQ